MKTIPARDSLTGLAHELQTMMQANPVVAFALVVAATAIAATYFANRF